MAGVGVAASQQGNIADSPECKRKLKLDDMADAVDGSPESEGIQDDSPKPKANKKPAPAKPKATAKAKATARAKGVVKASPKKKPNAKASPKKQPDAKATPKKEKPAEREKSFARRWRPDGHKASTYWQCLRDTFNMHVRDNVPGPIYKMED